MTTNAAEWTVLIFILWGVTLVIEHKIGWLVGRADGIRWATEEFRKDRGL